MGLEERIKATEEKYRELIIRGCFLEAGVYLQELLQMRPEEIKYIDEMEKIQKAMHKGRTNWSNEVNKAKNFTDSPRAYKTNELLNSGKSEEALTFADECLRINPEDYELWNSRGAVLVERGDIRGAMESFQKTITINPMFTVGYNNIATLLVNTNMYEAAEAFYLQSIRADPESATPYAGLGSVYARLNMNEQALEFLKKALQINPNDSSSWNNIGMVFETIGRYAEATISYNESIRLDPDDYQSFFNMGNVLSKQGMYKESVKSLKRATELQPQSSLFHAHLGQMYCYVKMFHEARLEIDEALKINPDNHFAYIAESTFYQFQGKYDDAIRSAVISLSKAKYDSNEEGQKRSNIGARTRMSFLNIKDIFSEEKSAAELLDKIKKNIDSTQLYDQVGIVMSAFFQYTGDSLKASSLNENILEILRFDPSLKSEERGFFRSEGSSRNIVKSTKLENIVDRTNYIIKIVVPKPGLSLKRLEEEYIVGLWLFTNLEHYEKSQDEPQQVIEVAQPLVLLKDEKNYIYVEKKMVGNNLKDILQGAKKEDKERYARTVIETIAKITAIATRELTKSDEGLEIRISDSANNSHSCKLGEMDYAADVRRRFVERLPAKRGVFGSDHAKIFLQEYERFMSGSETKAFQNGDSYPWNWIISPQGATQIDYETKMFANIFTDLACLLESEEFNEIDREEQIHFFLRELEKYDPKLADKVLSDWKKQYQKAAIHRTLTKTGAAYQAKDMKTAQYNIQRTTELLETQPTLQKAFKKYIKATEMSEAI